MEFTNTFKMWVYVSMIFLCSTLVIGMEVSNVKGTISNGDVSNDFGNAIVKVSPEKSLSFNYEHTQILSITNKYASDLYFYLDGNFKKNLRDVTIKKVDYVNKYTNPIRNCYINNDTLNEVCEDIPAQLYQDVIYSDPFGTNVKDWGGEKHYISTNGVLIKSGSTQDFQIKYKVTDKSGKWNFRVWGNIKDEWSCILDTNNNCVFDYVLDPSYDMSNLSGLSSYYKFDEGTGNTAYDSNTTSANDMTKAANAGWTTYGIIVNASTYSNSATSYFRDTVATALPNKQGWINLWLNHTANASANAHYVWEISDATANNRLILYFANPNNDLTLISVIGGSAVSNLVCPSASHNIQINKWYMITTFWNTTSDLYYIYVNGTNVTGCTKTNAGDLPAQTEIATGNSGVSPASGNALVGWLDEIGVWNRGIPTSDELSGLYNGGVGCSYPFNCWSVGNYTITVSNFTFTNQVYETSNEQYLLNLSWGNNVSSIDTVYLNYHNYSIPASNHSSGSCGSNCTWSLWNTTQRPDLVNVNNTQFSLNFTFTARYDNGTNETKSSTNGTQAVLWSYNPLSMVYTQNVIEGNYLSFAANISNYGNSSGVNLSSVLSWNSTNISGSYVSNGSSEIKYNYTFLLGLIGSLNLTIPAIPYTIVSFNGTTFVRNSSINVTQTLYQVYINNCSGVNTSTKAINYTIYDEDTLSLISTADLIGTYTVFDTNSSYGRNFILYSYDNSSHYVCIYPAWAEYNISRNLTYSAPGYITRTQTVNNFVINNASLNISLYLGNVSSIGNVIIGLVDQNNQYITNYTVEVYLVSGSNYTLLDQGYTNYEGKTVFQLNTVQGYYYAFKVYDTNSTLVYFTQPPFKLYSTEYTFQIVIGQAIDFINLLNINTIDVNLIYNTTTKTFTYTWNDSNNVSSSYCLDVQKMNLSFTSIYYNCSTNKSNSLNYTITEALGTFYATGYITLYSDGNTYPVANTYAYLKNDIFGKEGILISFLFFILTIMAAVYNVPFGMLLGVMGLGFGYALGMSTLGYGSIITVLICVIILIVRSKK